MSSFGAQLKKEREKQGISLEDISVSTKIGTRMLRALEEEHFDQLPGGIFNKGFIRAYARCLHMDEEQAVADYLAATSPKNPVNDEQPPLLEPPARDDNPASTGLPWGTFAIILLIIALGFGAWGFYSRESEKTTQNSGPPVANAPNPSPGAGTSAEPSPPEQKPAEAVDSSPKPAKQLPDTTPVDSTLSQPASPPAPAASSSQPQPPVPATGAFQVLIKAREDSWLSVSVDGEIVTHALLSAPAQKSIRGEKEIVIKAGNVGALDFEFNGKKLPNQGDYGEVKTLTFDAHGLQASSPKPEVPPKLP